MSSLNKGVEKVEVALKWDPSTGSGPVHDLDVIAAVYGAGDPAGEPVYLVHFESRSPDGTITLSRDSRTGQGLGIDESMVLELTRLAPAYGRVVVGVAIQQGGGRVAFGDVRNTLVIVKQGYDELFRDDFDAVRDSTAATVVEFTREARGTWAYRPAVRGFDCDPTSFTRLMGAAR
ncbi:TerD family protein [Streptomyces sudanensis]|uniref:TerD family protein n=1 Tax=Streptomyces sudanensis TaxID=436397 RepID=UPI0020CB9A8C|nr:TerD family protein [Streptomyces sudanensis]MCP9956974.1 TerD family protein [Streptomyces sudanensis]MCP9986178.1 TerD family protein [Streptomyces sudanensis]MCQ0002439.1 TerD family protein [Streptomyces sudanensis]